MKEPQNHGGSKRWAKGVVIVGLLAVLLGGCAMGGTSQADVDLALVIDQVLLVAREELAPTATGGASFFFRTAGGSIDLRDAVPLLGGVGDQSIANTAAGDLSFSKDTLNAYVSPSEDA